MIKELLKEGNKRYFIAEGELGNILFNIYEWESDKPKTLDEIETAFLTSDIPSYLKEKYSLEQLLNEPLAIFELSMYGFGSELQPKCMSLWEYKTFIKKDQDIPKGLKMAFINQPSDEDCFYIACESYDNDSMVTRKNMDIVNKHTHVLYNELEAILGKSFSHVESY